MTPAAEFAARVGQATRDRRKALRISQEAFAERICMHRTYFGAVERGEKDCQLSTLQRVATGLGIPLLKLIESADLRSKHPQGSGHECRDTGRKTARWTGLRGGAPCRTQAEGTKPGATRGCCGRRPDTSISIGAWAQDAHAGHTPAIGRSLGDISRDAGGRHPIVYGPTRLRVIGRLLLSQ
jgi:transcriptional regulator with XRE-family HTH domain